MILADTSRWDERDRASGSAAHLRMRDLLAGGESALATCEGTRSPYG